MLPGYWQLTRYNEHQLALNFETEFLPPKIEATLPIVRAKPKPKPGATDNPWEAVGFLPIEPSDPVGIDYEPPRFIQFSQELYWRGYDRHYWWPSKTRRYLDCPACARFGGKNRLTEDQEATMDRGRRVHRLIAGEEEQTNDPRLLGQAAFARSYLDGLGRVGSEEGMAFRTAIGGEEFTGAARLDACGGGEIVEIKSKMPTGQEKIFLALQLGMESWAYQAGKEGRGRPTLTVLDLAHKKVWRFEGADCQYLAGTLYHLGQMRDYPINPDCPHLRLQKGRQMLPGFNLTNEYTDWDWIQWQKARLAAEKFCQSGRWEAVVKKPTRALIAGRERLTFEQETERLWVELGKR